MGILSWLFKRKPKHDPWCASYVKEILRDRDVSFMAKLFVKEMVEKGILKPVDYGNGQAYVIPKEIRPHIDEEARRVAKDFYGRMFL